MSTDDKYYTSMQDYSNMKGITYECMRCGAKFDGKEFEFRGRIACPECNCRVVKKVRPPIVKRVKCT